MDSATLDQMSKALAAGAPRRSVLKLLGGGMAAGLLGGARPSTTRAYRKTCTRFVLSGGRDILDPIHVDDDLKVIVNGTVVFNDRDGAAEILNPIWFTAKSGDTLRIVAKDVQPLGRKLSNIWLHCRENNPGDPLWIVQGVSKTFETEERWRRWYRRTRGVFVDETVTI